MAAEVAKNEQWKPHVNPWLIAATVALEGNRPPIRLDVDDGQCGKFGSD
jgi:hypothetical protein